MKNSVILTYEQIKEKLASYNLKVTQQRIVVYEALMRSEKHPSVEELYESVKPQNPTISLATIYKALEAFLEAGLVKKVQTDENLVRYDGNMEKHNHIYCINTSELIDFQDDELNALIEDFFKKKNIKNFKIHDIQLQINGEKIVPEQDVSIH